MFNYFLTRESDLLIVNLVGCMTSPFYAKMEDCLNELSGFKFKNAIFNMSNVDNIDQCGLDMFLTMLVISNRNFINTQVCGLDYELRPRFSIILKEFEIKNSIWECFEALKKTEGAYS